MKTLRPLFVASWLALAAATAAAAPAAAPLPVPPLALPAPVSHTLPNGLRVVVFPSARLPIVHVQLLVDAGSASESDASPGVAPLTLALLREGTPSRTAEQVTSDLAQVGATFSTSCTRDFALVACGVESRSFETAVEVMSDVAINPLFGGEGFEDARAAVVRRAVTTRGGVADAADALVAAEVFGAHPYAHDPDGDPRLIGSINLATVQAFHRDRWRPDRAVLVIAGDVTPDHAFAAATDWFGRWVGHSAPDRDRPLPRAAAGVHVLDLPGAERAEVRVAIPGPGLASPGWPTWSLAVTGFEASRLPEGARIERIDGREASALVLAASAPAANAAATAKTLAATLRAYAGAPPTGEALAALRRRVAQRYPLTIGTLGAFVSQWQSLDDAGAPAGAIATLGQREAAADPAAALGAFASAPVVLVAGPAATLRGALAAAGLGDVSLDSTAVIGAGQRALAPPTPEARARGRAVVTAALAAHGGAQALANVRTLVMEGTIDVRSGTQDMAGQFSAVRQDPDHFSFSTRLLTMESRQLYDGHEGWAFLKSDSAAVLPIESVGVHRLRAAAASDLVHELRMAAAPSADPVWRGKETVGARTCDLVEYSTPFGLQRIAVDADSHQVLELASSRNARGDWVDRRVLSDFRPVNGLLLPWAEERTVGGQRMWRMSAKSVGVNVEIPPSLFRKPSTAP